jgi:HD-GYP domain-containing protein (c-di-GMP phosphodiesterase class II)
MFVIGVDRSWLETPFLRHRFLIHSEDEIAKLRDAGVREVTIDPSLGLDTDGSTFADRPPTDTPSDRESDRDSPPGVTSNGLEAARAVRDQARQALQRLFDGVKAGAPMNLAEVEASVDGLVNQLTEDRTAIMLLTQLSQAGRTDRDPCAHALDVSVLAMAIGQVHGLPMPALKQLGMGALLHDIGELRIPAELFAKTTPFTDDDRRIIETHPMAGVAILHEVTDLPPAVGRILAEHHERLDGSGYPMKLRNPDISVPGQIVGLIERYDAMVSPRGTRPALPIRQAVSHLYQHERRNHFDRTLIDRLIQCVGVYPLGTAVELNTGERGVVIAVNPDARLKPTVKVMTDPAGQRYPTSWIIDLAALSPTAPPRSITRVIEDAPTDWRDLFI